MKYIYLIYLRLRMLIYRPLQNLYGYQGIQSPKCENQWSQWSKNKRFHTGQYWHLGTCERFLMTKYCSYIIPKPNFLPRLPPRETPEKVQDTLHICLKYLSKLQSPQKIIISGPFIFSFFPPTHHQIQNLFYVRFFTMAEKK